MTHITNETPYVHHYWDGIWFDCEKCGKRAISEFSNFCPVCGEPVTWEGENEGGEKLPIDVTALWSMFDEEAAKAE